MEIMGLKEWSEISQMNGVNEPMVIVHLIFYEESAWEKRWIEFP